MLSCHCDEMTSLVGSGEWRGVTIKGPPLENILRRPELCTFRGGDVCGRPRRGARAEAREALQCPKHILALVGPLALIRAPRPLDTGPRGSPGNSVCCASPFLPLRRHRAEAHPHPPCPSPPAPRTLAGSLVVVTRTCPLRVPSGGSWPPHGSCSANPAPPTAAAAGRLVSRWLLSPKG